MPGSSNSNPIRVDTPLEDYPVFPEGHVLNGNEDYLLSDEDEVSSREEDYLLSNDGYHSGEKEEDAEGDGAENGPGEDGEGEPLNATADFLELEVPFSWAPPDLLQLSKTELIVWVCELERDLGKMREEFFDVKNHRRFEWRRFERSSEGWRRWSKPTNLSSIG